MSALISLYAGTPGSGKTYEAVKRILSALKKKNGRRVYTNIDGINTTECREWIMIQTGLDSDELDQRLIVYSDDQLTEFWKHTEDGSLIVFDEIQRVFPSIDYNTQKNKELAAWASTHRHHGIDIIFISQHPERVGPAIRNLFEWVYHYRKINFFGKAVQKKYMRSVYAGDEIRGKPLDKSYLTYDPKVFLAYQSYVAKDMQEHKMDNFVNVLKHPIFFFIPVALCLVLYFGSKSSFATGDLFGASKYQAEIQKRKNAPVSGVQNNSVPVPVGTVPVSGSVPAVANSTPVTTATAASVSSPINTLPVPPPPLPVSEYKEFEVEGYVEGGEERQRLLIALKGVSRHVDPIRSCKSYRKGDLVALCRRALGGGAGIASASPQGQPGGSSQSVSAPVAANSQVIAVTGASGGKL